MTSIKPIRPLALVCSIVSKQIKKSKNRSKTQAAAHLLHNNEVVSTLKRKKRRFKYSRKLERFIYAHRLKKGSLKPLEKYLVKQLRQKEARNLELLLPHHASS